MYTRTFQLYAHERYVCEMWWAFLFMGQSASKNTLMLNHVSKVFLKATLEVISKRAVMF